MCVCVRMFMCVCVYPTGLASASYSHRIAGIPHGLVVWSLTPGRQAQPYMVTGGIFCSFP